MSNASYRWIQVHALTAVPVLFSGIKAVLEHHDCPGVRVTKVPPHISAYRHSDRGLCMVKTLIIKTISKGDLADLVYLRACYPEIPLLALCMDSEEPCDRSALMSLGVHALLPPQTRPRELRDAVLRVARGENLLEHPVSTIGLEVSHHAGLTERSGGDLEAVLTAREKEVLYLLARGATNSEIAACLFMSNNTVKTHVRNILGKLHVSNRTQAALIARECLSVRPEGGADDWEEWESVPSQAQTINGGAERVGQQAY